MTRSHWMLLGALAASVVLFNVPYGQYVLYPFELFATFLHESGHGLTALVLGGELREIVIRPDTSGYALYGLPGSVFAQGAVGSAGYLGTAFFGAALLWLGTKSERRSRLVLAGIGATMILMDVVFVRNLFGFVAIGLIGAALVLIAKKAGTAVAAGLLHLLAAQSCLNALLNIRVLYAVGSSTVPGQGRSDAAAMEALFLLPYWFWASLWLVLSIGLLTLALWRVWRRLSVASPGRGATARARVPARATAPRST